MKFPVEEFVLVGLLLAEECREHRDAIELIRRFHAGDLGRRGQEIPECPHLIADGASLDLAGPARDQRHANASFVHVPLDAAQRAGALEEFRVHPAFLVRAVIAGEKYNRVVIDLQLFEFLQQFANISVQARNHGGLVLLHLRPVLF